MTEKVDRLILRLRTTEPMDEKKKKELYREFSRRTTNKMIDDGVTWGEASGAPTFYQLDEKPLREFMKVKNQDLDWQCDTVDQFLTYHRTTGDIIPPHFPGRIVILLRKAKDFEREQAFLEAWIPHCRAMWDIPGSCGGWAARLAKLKGE